MDSVVNSLMLVCAVLAALAAGVLLGYIALKGLFSLCSLHSRSLGAAKRAAESQAQTVGA